MSFSPPKLKSFSQAAVIARRARKMRKRIVFTNGCFDILHVGHVRYLRRAKSLGDLLVVGLNNDASVRRLKGPHRPLVHERERAEVLAALDSVDYVVLFGEATPLRLIKAIRPHFLVKGGDWKKKDIVGSDFVDQLGGKTLSLPYVSGRSTTALIARIKKAL
jgi:D-beta-D-heptose 7-phosphate kinase/D-beta-D-heptose 1-phosphate adenosyltransferase